MKSKVSLISSDLTIEVSVNSENTSFRTLLRTFLRFKIFGSLLVITAGIEPFFPRTKGDVHSYTIDVLRQTLLFTTLFPSTVKTSYQVRFELSRCFFFLIFLG